jgi:chromosomal replication initiator protein
VAVHTNRNARAVVRLDGDAQVWADLLKYMRVHQPEICRQWFDQLELLGISGGVLRIRAHSTIHRDYLQRACLSPFNDAAQTATGRLISVRFYGPEEEVEQAKIGPVVSAGLSSSEPGSSEPGSNGLGSNGLSSNGLGMGVVPALPGVGHAGQGHVSQSQARAIAGASDGLSVSPGGLAASAHVSGQSDVLAGNTYGQRAGVIAGATVEAKPDVLSRGQVGTSGPTVSHDLVGSQLGYAMGTQAGVVARADGGLQQDFAQGPGMRSLASGVLPSGVLTAAQTDRLYNDGLVINPDYGFDNFVPGPSSRLAHAAALAVATNPGRAYNPFFVHGGVGLGKTHLLQAICLAIQAQRPEAVIYYTSCEGFMTQFMDAVAAGAMNLFRHKFRHVDVLVIDDIHFLAKRDRTQEEFFHTFNSLYQSHKQIVLSSDAAPEEIPDLEDRLVSRFKWGLVAPISAPDYETRVQILKSKAKMRGFELSEVVAQHVASRIDTNIRELEGAVVKLQVMANIENRQVDLELVKLALGDSPMKAEPSVQIQTIINAVTEFFNVKVTDLQSKRRQRSIAMPRQLCMYLARRNTRFSLEEIGGYFGGRDHTTVMHAVKTIESRASIDTEFSEQVKAIEARLRGGLPPMNMV